MVQGGFRLECRATKLVREGMGLTNVKLMVPFCRTVEEGRRVLAVMAEAGLKRGEGGLEVYVMCEVPSNVVLAEEFAEVFDGFSISNRMGERCAVSARGDTGAPKPHTSPVVTGLVAAWVRLRAREVSSLS